MQVSWAAAIACFLATLLACEIIRRLAIGHALLDAVNERSLHKVPTPRLGGVAILGVMLVAFVLGWRMADDRLRALAITSAALGIVGLRDDLRPVSASTRMILQLVAAVAFLSAAGIPPLLVARGVAIPFPTVITGAILTIWIVGVLNIFNFMDGMDGLAGFQTLSAAATFAAIFAGRPAAAGAIALACAAAGFLAHNYPPARIFLGDAGSYFIGTFFAGLAVLGLHEGIAITESALALAPFLLDGTFTILRRALRREKVWRAHRTHLYQRAVQAGLEHREVLLVYSGWMALAAGLAIMASGGAVVLALCWVAMLLALGLVHRWVTRLESNRAESA